MKELQAYSPTHTTHAALYVHMFVHTYDLFDKGFIYKLCMCAEIFAHKVTTSDMTMVTLCIHACSKISVDNIRINYICDTHDCSKRRYVTHERAKNSFKHTVQRTQHGQLCTCVHVHTHMCTNLT